ncbi:MAG: LytTR family transcriptional regulator DNA-binding domain-containing protein [Acidobacteriota bacterium]|nr:LytTR family transcriptional regulator DNA-binding domain-containing protein [Acidobacteriota bacterium]
MKIRTLIVDDEPLARERVRGFLAEEPDVEIIGEAENGAEAVFLINKHQPDLIFLDVQMPELSGFDVIQAVELENLPYVVFITAYDNYAIRAFDIHALDYLLKPFTRERLQLALKRFRGERLKSVENQSLDERFIALLNSLGQSRQYAERVLIKAKGRIFFLQVTEIDWIESAGNYILLHVGREKYMLRETMKTMEERLDPKVFLRIHRSTLVNTYQVKEIYPLFSGDYNVVLKNGTELALSRHYRDRLLELFNL